MSEHIVVRVNGEAMKKVAADRGIPSNAQFARDLGVTRSYLQQVLSGARTVGTEFIVKLHDLTGVNFPADYRFPELFVIERREN